MTISCVNNTVIGRLCVKQRVRTYQQLIKQCNAPGKYPAKSLRHAANATAPVVCLVLCEVLLCGAVGEQRAALSCAESNIDMGANSWNLSCIPRCVKEQTRARNVDDGKHSIREHRCQFTALNKQKLRQGARVAGVNVSCGPCG